MRLFNDILVPQSEERTSDGTLTLKGFCPELCDMEFDANLKPYFSEVSDFRSGWYRAVWIAPDLRSMVTYCEGDVTFVKYPTREAYDSAYTEAEAYYAVY